MTNIPIRFAFTNKMPHYLVVGVFLAQAFSSAHAEDGIFARDNLMSWCIVPFDARKRGPEERARMLEQLGIRKFAYDWRAEHIPAFDAEVAAMKKHGVEMTAWWFPGALNSEALAILDCIKRNDIHPQLWVMMEAGPHLRMEQAFEPTPEAQAAHVERMVAGVKPIAAEAAKLGCKVALYNHGGWFGVPENQISIIERLKKDGVDNVGMVYTQHHGHGEIDRFAELFPKMKPHLLAVSLNGMNKDGDLTGSHDLGTAPLGQGDQDLRLLRIIKESGWAGPVGIIGETASVDVETRLQDHLAGLDWLLPQLDGKPPGAKPVPKSWRNPGPEFVASVSPEFGKGLRGGILLKGDAAPRATMPLTVECWARLESAKGFNILVASDPKSSSAHWSLYSVVGTGVFSVYQPGRGGVFSSNVNICDGKWRHLAAVLSPDKVELYVDGQEVLGAPATLASDPPAPAGLAIGRLVEGGPACDGVIDNVRISQGKRPIIFNSQPSGKDAQTLGLWNFDDNN